MASITFSHVTKRFGDTIAVDRLDLAIRDGEFMVLLGPSGCGKSTALRMLAGLDDPTEGAIEIDGRSVLGVAPKDRDVAMVFQSYALYPHLTVARNIEFPLKPRGLARAERRRRVLAAAEMLGLVELLDRRPAQLSGGQRQRVALARAIVREPRAFLMDEPLSNLDAKLRAQTRTEIVALHERLGTTFVYVTHDQVEAMTMADRVAVMSQARLQQVGSPQEVYDRPANTFVARFVGNPPMNLLPGSLEPARGSITVAGAAIAAPPAIRDRFSARASVAVEVGIRPEHLRLVEGVSASGIGGAPAWRDAIGIEVSLVEQLGHEQLVHGATADGGELVVRIPQTGGGVHRSVTPVGTRLYLGVDQADVHLFDANTGERLDG